MRTAAIVLLWLDASLVVLGIVRLARGASAGSDAAGSALTRSFTIIGALVALVLLVPAGLLVLTETAVLLAVVLAVLALPLSIVTSGGA